MNWRGMRNGRLLAIVYLVTFPVTVVGLVALLASQVAWNRLALGRELPGAWRTVRG